MKISATALAVGLILAAMCAPMHAADDRVDPCVSAASERTKAQAYSDGELSSITYEAAAEEFAACAFTFPDASQSTLDPRACEAKLSAADAYVQAVIELKAARAGTAFPVPVATLLEDYIPAEHLYFAVSDSCEGASVEAAKRGESTVRADLRGLNLREAVF